jgi:hypothetical protein
MNAYVGIDVACAKGKRLPIVICTRCSDGLRVLPLKEFVHQPPRGEGNAQAIQTGFLQRFADETAEYLKAIENAFSVTIRRIALDAPSAPKTAGYAERECERALRTFGVSYISTPSGDEFEAIRRKVEQHLAAGGSEAHIPHANQLWMLVGFALFGRLRDTWECMEVFPQATAHAMGAARIHKSKPGGVQCQLDAAARYTRSSGKMTVSELSAACFGEPHDRSDAYLSAWIASLDEHEREPVGPAGPNAIWIPKLSACKQFATDANIGDLPSFLPSLEPRQISDQRSSTAWPEAVSIMPRPQPALGAKQGSRDSLIPDAQGVELGVRLFKYLVEAANRGAAVGISYGGILAYVHGVDEFRQAARRNFRPSDGMAAVRIAWSITDAAGGRKKVARSGCAIDAGMDTFIWNGRRPFDRPEGAWNYSIPYTRKQWLSVFPDGERRLITATELRLVAAGGE